VERVSKSLGDIAFVSSEHSCLSANLVRETSTGARVKLASLCNFTGPSGQSQTIGVKASGLWDPHLRPSCNPLGTGLGTEPVKTRMLPRWKFLSTWVPTPFSNHSLQVSRAGPLESHLANEETESEPRKVTHLSSKMSLWWGCTNVVTAWALSLRPGLGLAQPLLS
jgi:hypothetical protein